MNPLELSKLRERGLNGYQVHLNGSNFWSKRNAPMRRKAPTYDSDRKFSAKPLISSQESLQEFACTALPRAFKETPVNIGRVNKVFAAQWHGQDEVILGTKCNNLLVCDLSDKSRENKRKLRKIRANEKTRENRKRNFDGNIIESAGEATSSTDQSNSSGASEIQKRLSENGSSVKWIPSLRSSPRSKWSRDQVEPHSGIHAIKINPSRTMLATGALYPSDVAVYSLPDFQPIAVGEGHHDWLFDLEWLDDEFLISGSRDSTLALWRFRNDEDRISCSHVKFVRPPQPGTTANNFDGVDGVGNRSLNFNNDNEDVQRCPDNSWDTVKLKRKYPAVEPIALSRVRKFDKVRAISVSHQLRSVTAVSLNCHLCTVDLESMKQTKIEKLSELFSECVCLCHSSDEKLLAIGSRDHFSFFDNRTLREVKDVKLPKPRGADEIDMYSSIIPTGVRSISWRGPTVTVGTGSGNLLFYDVRNCSFLKCDGYGCLSRLNVGEGYSPYSRDEFQLDYPPFPTAVYTHCYDSTGLRLLTAGGPIASVKHGNYAALWH